MSLQQESLNPALFYADTYKQAYDLVAPELISWEFYEPYTTKEPPFKPMGLFTFLRTYSRLLPTLNRREKWCEVVLRVVEFSLSLDTKTPLEEKRKEAEDLFQGIFSLKCFPAGRTLWVGDKNVTGTKENNFNCSGRLVDSLEAYPEAMYLLMVGAGVGFSVEEKYTRNLPKFYSTDVTHEEYTTFPKMLRSDFTTVYKTKVDPSLLEEEEEVDITLEVLVNKGLSFIEDISTENTSIVISIGDSKEGWSGALKTYLYALANPNITKITFIYDYIRPKGERLKRMGGRASGHEPLQLLFKKILWLINTYGEFTSVQWMDIMNFIAEVIVVGGVRRSSLLCIGDVEDENFISAKYELFKYLPGINTGYCYGLKEAVEKEGVIPHEMLFSEFMDWATEKGFNISWEDPGIQELFAKEEVWALLGYKKLTLLDLLIDGLLPALEKQVDIWDAENTVIDAIDKLDPKYRYRKSRVMSNNSVALYDKPHKEKMYGLFRYTKDNGEPALLNFQTGRKRREDLEIFNPCFVYGTKILTTDGYKEIGSLCDQEVILINADGNESRGKVWSSGSREVIKLKLSNHEEIICTPDHLFKTLDGEARAKDLKHKQLYPYLKPPSLNKEYQLFGYVQGDGCLSRLASIAHKGVEVCIGNKDGDVLTLAEELGWKYTQSARGIYVSNLKDRLICLGFSSNTLETRLLPTTYRGWKKEDKAAFISGCYSANGSVLGCGRVTYKSICKKLLEQIQSSLDYDFGISSYITTNQKKEVEFSNGVYACKESYDLNIASYRDLVNFFNQIGFIHTYKADKLAKHIFKKSPIVRSISPAGVDNVYDFSEPLTNWGVVEGFVAHNCVEILLRNYGTCNLTELNVAAFIDEFGNFNTSDFCKYVALVTRMGSRMTMVNFWHPEWDKVQKEDRLLGVSLTGQVDAWNKIKDSNLVENILVAAKAVATQEARTYHNYLGIPQAKLVTTGKPSGSISTLAGVSSGAHAPYGSTYIRRIRASSSDPIASALRDLGVPVSPENGQGTLETADTWVFSFVVKTPAETRAIDEPAIDQLERYKQLMQNYVEHNVSYTVSCAEDEWFKAADWLLEDENWDNFVGVSFLPRFDPSEHPGSYPQMPYEVCTEEQYKEMESKIPKLTEEEFITLIAKYETEYEEYDLGSDCGTLGCPIK